MRGHRLSIQFVMALLVLQTTLLSTEPQRQSTKTPTPANPRPWTEVKVGQSNGGFSITPKREIQYAGRTLHGAEIESWVEELVISPIASGRHAVALPISMGDAGFAYLLDLDQWTIRAMRFKSPLYRLASWSPSFASLLLASSYETETDLHLVTMSPFNVSDVSLPAVSRPTELIRFDIEGVRWESESVVIVPAHLICNRFEQSVRSQCDPSVALRRFNFAVNTTTRRAAVR